MIKISSTTTYGQSMVKIELTGKLNKNHCGDSVTVLRLTVLRSGILTHKQTTSVCISTCKQGITSDG